MRKLNDSISRYNEQYEFKKGRGVSTPSTYGHYICAADCCLVICSSSFTWEILSGIKCAFVWHTYAGVIFCGAGKRQTSVGVRVIVTSIGDSGDEPQLVTFALI